MTFQHFIMGLLMVSQEPAAPASGEWETLELPNGIQATLVHAKGAPKESFFTFLPAGLLSDDAGKAQFSHLLEHMVIRSTDPESLEAGGLLLNGETTALAMRLEAIAPPPRWREALSRHARWLAASHFPKEVLEREKGRIAEEMANTIRNGFTHKWAEVAWNQVVRHGKEHAAVRGDVDRATVEEVKEYAARRVGAGPAVRIIVIGPVPTAEVRQSLLAEIGRLKGEGASAKPPPAPAAAQPRGRDSKATWDLDAHHYLEWYPLPYDAAADRAAAQVLTMLLNMRLQGEAALKELGANAFASPDLEAPEGRVLAISASLRAPGDVAKVAAALQSSVARLLAPAPGSPSLDFLVKQVAAEAAALPDFAELRKLYANQPGADLIEAQVVLGQMYREISTGLPRVRLAEAFRGLTGAKLKEVAGKHLLPERRSSLQLSPMRGQRGE